jgi:hypothetical protein
MKGMTKENANGGIGIVADRPIRGERRSLFLVAPRRIGRMPMPQPTRDP